MVKKAKKAEAKKAKAKKGSRGRVTGVPMSTADTSSDATTILCPEFSATSLSDTLESMRMSSLTDLSGRVTQILSTAYGISMKRSEPLTKEILSWSVDQNWFEYDAQFFIETLARPNARDHTEGAKYLTPREALGVVFDQQEMLDCAKIDHCWKTVAAGLVMTCCDPLENTNDENPRTEEELTSWVVKIKLMLLDTLQDLDVDIMAPAVLNLIDECSDYLGKWHKLVLSFNSTEMYKMAQALKACLNRKYENPRKYWLRRRLTYDDGIPKIRNG
jgi:hypothetical protein